MQRHASGKTGSAVKPTKNALIVLAGTSTEVVQKFLNWNETSKAVTRIKGVCGALVVSGGIWMIYTAP